MIIENFRQRMLELRETEFSDESDLRISTAKAARKALLQVPVELARKYGAVNTIPVQIEAGERRALIGQTLVKLEKRSK